jgi:hypothetical protein
MADKKSKAKKQEELARKQGDALIASMNLHLEELVHTVKKIDDYIVTVAFEGADGMYGVDEKGELEWNKPGKFGAMHAQIIIQDRDDKRFVPNLEISVRIFDNEGTVITESDAPFMWHPYVFHYGLETVLPDEGEYIVEVKIQKPGFARHTKNHGKRYQSTVTARLDPIKVVPPQEDGLDTESM